VPGLNSTPAHGLFPPALRDLNSLSTPMKQAFFSSTALRFPGVDSVKALERIPDIRDRLSCLRLL
jgi:hypothetical protein